MDSPYWHKQTAAQPLFPDLLWSRPEHKAFAGKLLIVGGNAHGFAAPAEAFAAAQKAGAGTVRVLLPDSLQRTVGRVLEAGEYAPSTPAGSFSQKALAELLGLAQWADGVLLAGDLGRNSETAILLEKFVEKYSGQLTITKDAADYFTANPAPVLGRPGTTVVISFAQLQKIATNVHFTTAFAFDMDLLRLVEALHEFTELHPVQVVTKHLDRLFVAAGGQISSTQLEKELEVWRAAIAARISVWWLQNPGKPFEALTTALATTD